MWEVARAKLREWYIVGIGLFLIAGGLTLAAHQNSPTPAVEQTAASVPEAASRTPQHPTTAAMNALPAPRAPAAPAVAAQPSAAVPRPAPATANVPQTAAPIPAPPAHEHVAAADTAPASAQTPQVSNAMDGALRGDAAAGRQVFRKCQACHSDRA
jgi:nitrite reductase (NO-forming)